MARAQAPPPRRRPRRRGRRTGSISSRSFATPRNGTPIEDHRGSSELEPHSEACDASRDHAGDIAECRTRLEIRRRWRGGVQYVENVDVDIDPPAAADREILARAKVQNILCRDLLFSEWFQAECGVAVLRDRGAAIRIGLAENIRPLSQQPVPALQESRERDVSEQAIAAGDIAGPRPGGVATDGQVIWAAKK